MVRGMALDCNETLLAGSYYVSSNTANIPFKGYGCLLVTNHYGIESWVVQIAIKLDDNTVYFRTTGEEFSEIGWVKLLGESI